MDARIERLLTERFEENYVLRVEKARLEARLITLHEEDQETQNAIRDAEGSLQQLENSLPQNLVEQAVRFAKNHKLRTEKADLSLKLIASEDEFLDVQASIKRITALLTEIVTATASMLASLTARKGPGRPRRSETREDARPASSGLGRQDGPAATNPAQTPPRTARDGTTGENTEKLAHPGLYVCSDDLITPQIAETDTFESSRGGGIKMLSKYHPTVVKMNDRWTQIWCPDCGDNSKLDGHFFTGLGGLQAHMRRGVCQLMDNEKATLENTTRMCGQYHLTDFELEDLRSGKKQVMCRRGGKESKHTYLIDYSIKIGDFDGLKTSLDHDQKPANIPIREPDVEPQEPTGREVEIAESQPEPDRQEQHQSPYNKPQSPSRTSPLGLAINMDDSASSRHSTPTTSVANIPSSSQITEFKEESDADEMPDPVVMKRKITLEDFLESGREKRVQTDRAGST